MTKPLRSSPARKPVKPEGTADRRRRLQQRITSLSRWDNEGGATPSGPQQRVEMDAAQARTPPLSDAELVQVLKRVIALENVVIALLAKSPDGDRDLVREMAIYISPRPGFTDHPLTIRAAAQMNRLVERAGRLVTLSHRQAT
jgi:hypothetical protein